MTKKQDYPIRLEQLFFVRSTVVSVPEHQPPGDGAKSIGPENSIKVEPQEGKAHWFTAHMRAKLNQAMDKQWPYFVDMECIAILSTDGSLSAEDEIRGVTLNAHSVLYGAIREAVAWITGRHPYGALLLGFSVLQQKSKDAEVSDAQPEAAGSAP